MAAVATHTSRQTLDRLVTAYITNRTGLLSSARHVYKRRLPDVLGVARIPARQVAVAVEVWSYLFRAAGHNRASGRALPGTHAVHALSMVKRIPTHVPPQSRAPPWSRP